MILNFSEYIDATPATQINLGKLHIANVTGDESIPLSGASVNSLDYFQVTITLTELQRIDAIENSGSPGGDGTPLRLDVQDSAVRDIGTNGILPIADFQFIEISDTIAPVIDSVSLNYSTGTLLVSVSERVDCTPKSRLDLAKFHLSATVAGNADIILTGADAVEVDDLDGIITIYLTELQRVKGIQNSSTPGGDGTAVFLNIQDGAFQDIAQIDVAESIGLAVDEAADVIIPVCINATLDLNDGRLTFFSSETIDADPIANVDPSRFYVANASGSRSLPLTGAAVTASESRYTTMKLTEEQRVAAIAMSGTPGGDGAAALLDLQDNAFRDIGTNPNAAQDGIFIL